MLTKSQAFFHSIQIGNTHKSRIDQELSIHETSSSDQSQLSQFIVHLHTFYLRCVPLGFLVRPLPASTNVVFFYDCRTHNPKFADASNGGVLFFLSPRRRCESVTSRFWFIRRHSTLFSCYGHGNKPTNTPFHLS